MTDLELAGNLINQVKVEYHHQPRKQIQSGCLGLVLYPYWRHGGYYCSGVLEPPWIQIYKT